VKRVFNIAEEEFKIFIVGKNINLGPLNIKNVDLYCKWDNDESHRKLSRNFFPSRPESFKKHLEENKARPPEEIFFEIWHKGNNKPIGFVGFNHVHWIDGIASIGLVIGEPEFWRQNIGTEAVYLILKYGFEELNLFKITGEFFSPNTGSRKVAEKIGMKEEIILKKQAYIAGEYVDEHMYSILRTDWLALKDNFNFE
jgi:RimJ/RimL family protein N-acetyltransferase